MESGLSVNLRLLFTSGNSQSHGHREMVSDSGQLGDETVLFKFLQEDERTLFILLNSKTPLFGVLAPAVPCNYLKGSSCYQITLVIKSLSDSLAAKCCPLKLG